MLCQKLSLLRGQLVVIVVLILAIVIVIVICSIVALGSSFLVAIICGGCRLVVGNRVTHTIAQGRDYGHGMRITIVGYGDVGKGLARVCCVVDDGRLCAGIVHAVDNHSVCVACSFRCCSIPFTRRVDQADRDSAPTALCNLDLRNRCWNNDNRCFPATSGTSTRGGSSTLAR